VKILFIRFSSIGDIVLTTPLLRCAKTQLKDAEIHFITKKKFASVIASNPYVDKLITIDESVAEVSAELKKEQYDFVIDLHHNIRSLRLKTVLGRPAAAFNKLNYEKWLLVQFKINKLPDMHIVDRYFETLKTMGITNDLKGLDYFIPEKDELSVKKFLPSGFQQGFHSLVLGGSYYTKQIPENKLKEIIGKSDLPLVLLGGKEEEALGQQLEEEFPGKVKNCCGLINLNQSASLIRQSQKVISSDTGLMHIAAAFKKEVHSVWGNTVKEFGMYPYLPGEGSKIHEITDLKCRPCSKLGYKKCPKGHFKCMNDISVKEMFKRA
jgi:ADP-heptose:LPS heptosyltransferase